VDDPGHATKVVPHSAKAFLRILAGKKLRAVEERLAFALAADKPAAPWIAPPSNDRMSQKGVPTCRHENTQPGSIV
jgi:hypothetical protein